MSAKVIGIYEQLVTTGGSEYIVYYDDGSVQTFKDYPTQEQLDA